MTHAFPTRRSSDLGLKVGIPCQLAPRLGEKMDARGEAPCHQYRVAREDVPSAFSGYGDRADTQFARRAFDRNAAQNPEFGALGLPGRRGSATDIRDRHDLHVRGLQLLSGAIAAVVRRHDDDPTAPPPALLLQTRKRKSVV